MSGNISPRIADHPTVRKVLAHTTKRPGPLADWSREVCLAAGADDVHEPTKVVDSGIARRG